MIDILIKITYNKQKRDEHTYKKQMAASAFILLTQPQSMAGPDEVILT